MHRCRRRRCRLQVLSSYYAHLWNRTARKHCTIASENASHAPTLVLCALESRNGTSGGLDVTYCRFGVRFGKRSQPHPSLHKTTVHFIKQTKFFLFDESSLPRDQLGLVIDESQPDCCVRRFQRPHHTRDALGGVDVPPLPAVISVRTNPGCSMTNEMVSPRSIANDFTTMFAAALDARYAYIPPESLSSMDPPLDDKTPYTGLFLRRPASTCATSRTPTVLTRNVFIIASPVVVANGSHPPTPALCTT